MDFEAMAAWCGRLQETSGRLDMTRILVEAFQEADVADLRPLILLLQGKVAPDWEGVELGLAEKLVLRALSRAAGLGPAGVAEATKAYHQIGDLGATAKALLGAKAKHRQTGLLGFGEEAARPSVIEVHAALLQIAQTSGRDSQARKENLLEALLARVGPDEALYVVRIVAGRMRLGVADMTVLDALAARHLGRGVRSVTEMPPEERAEQEALRAMLEHAFDLRSDLGVIAETLARGGPDAVAALKMEPGVPLRPMAAERLKTLPAIFAKQTGVPVDVEGEAGDGAADNADAGADGDGGAGDHDGGGADEGVGAPAAGQDAVPADGPGAAPLEPIDGASEGRPAAAVGMDYKYDGLRIQAHVMPDGVRLFSRRLEDLTAQFPDIVAALRAAFPDRTLIIEGEAVALDETGRMRPFQDISRRRGRKEGLGQDVTTLAGAAGRAGFDITTEIPVTMFLFDVLMVDGRSMIGEPFARRRKTVDELVASAVGGADRVRASTYRVAHDVADMEEFFQEAVAEGAEGIMCKQLDAPYKAGARGFAWIKFKTDYTEDLVDTMDLVAIGAFYGRGRRAGWYGALLCAARDPETGRFPSVCKLGTGFDDATLTDLKDRFAPHVAPARPRSVESEMKPDVWFEPALVMEVQAAELSLSPIHRAGWGRIRAGAGLAARFPRFMRWREDKSPEQATSVPELESMYRG